MLAIWIILSLVVGFVLGHFLWTKTKIVRVNVDVPVEKIVKEEVQVRPSDYDEYLAWKEHKDDYGEYLAWREHKDDWINLKNMIPDVTIQDDVKFDKILKAIDRVLNETEGGELSTPKKKKAKKEHKENKEN